MLTRSTTFNMSTVSLMPMISCHIVHDNHLHVVHVYVDNVEQVNCHVFPAYGVMHVQDKHHFFLDNDLNVVLV